MTKRSLPASDRPLTEHSFATGEVVLNYAELAGGSRPLVLIHGVVGIWQNWKAIFPLLSPDWHVYAIDMRGHGLSSHVEGRYNVDEYSRDTVRFIEGKVGQPAFLMGLSLGGLVALGTAGRRPDLVKAFVMEDPSFCYADHYEGTEFKEWFGQTRSLVGLGLTEARLRARVARLFPDFSIEARKELAYCLSHLAPGVLDAALEGRYFTRATSAPLLRAARRPALIMQADPRSGGGLPDDEAAYALDLLPDGRVIKWPDSGHVLHRKFPERFVQQVEAFFSDYV